MLVSPANKWARKLGGDVRCALTGGELHFSGRRSGHHQNKLKLRTTVLVTYLALKTVAIEPSQQQRTRNSTPHTLRRLLIKMMRTSVTKLARPALLSRTFSTTVRVCSGETGAPPKTGGQGCVCSPCPFKIQFSQFVAA